MLVEFADADLARCLASKMLLLEAYGPEMGPVLMRRISELRAVKCLGDLRSLPHIRTREVGKGRGQIALSVHNGNFLMIEPARPARDKDKVNWDTITEVKLVKMSSSLPPL